MIIAVDFDGTVVEWDYPRIGAPLPHAVKVLRQLVDDGHEIVLWTVREDHPTDINKRYLSEAAAWFAQRGIPLLGVNALPEDRDFRNFPNPRRKVNAHLFIDDRNLQGFPGWKQVLEIVRTLVIATEDLQ